MAADSARMARAGLVLSAGEIIGKLATLVLFAILARTLGVADFGIFSLGLGTGLLLASLATLGLDPRLIQLTGGDPASLPGRLSTLVAIRLVVSAAIIGVTALVVAAVLPDRVMAVTVIVLVASACCDTLSEAFRSAANSRQAQGGPAVVLVMQRLLALALVSAVLAAGGGPAEAATAYLAASATGTVLMGLATHRLTGVRPRVRGVSRAHLSDYWRSLPVTGVNDLVSMALFRLDVVFLAVLAGSVAVGHYTAAYRLLETVLFISWSIARVVLPALADTTTTDQQRGRTVTGALLLSVGLYLPYAALLLTRGDELVALIFGEGFVEPVVMVALAFAPVFFAVAQVGISALLALRPDPIVLAASAAALVVNVALNLLLIPRYGAAAAAAVTTLSYALQAGILLVGVRRSFTVSGLGRGLAIVSVASVASALVMLAPVPLVMAVVLGGAVYLGLWWVGSWLWDRLTLTGLIATLRPRAT